MPTFSGKNFKTPSWGSAYDLPAGTTPETTEIVRTVSRICRANVVSGEVEINLCNILLRRQGVKREKPWIQWSLTVPRDCPQARSGEQTEISCPIPQAPSFWGFGSPNEAPLCFTPPETRLGSKKDRDLKSKWNQLVQIAAIKAPSHSSIPKHSDEKGRKGGKMWKDKYLCIFTGVYMHV